MSDDDNQKRICKTGQRGAADDNFSASVDPVYPADRPEDIIAEIIEPHRLPEAILTKISVYFLNESFPASPAVRVTTANMQMISKMIDKLAPVKRSELVSRWAYAFVMRHRSADGLTVNLVAKLLGVSQQALDFQVHEWRKILKMPADSLTRAQMHSNGHRQRRITQQMKDARHSLKRTQSLKSAQG